MRRRVDMGALPYGTDQIVDAAMARALHADACCDHALGAWSCCGICQRIRSGIRRSDDLVMF
jgi:hypothetical protein